MEISVVQQGIAMGQAALLGVMLGLLYDLLFLFRTRRGLRLLGGGLDLLFWIAVTVSLFVFAVTVTGGEVRLFAVAVTCAGAMVYFLLLSRWVRKFGNWLHDLIVFLWKTLCYPFLLFFRLLKFFNKKIKNNFHYRLKWYKIRQIPEEIKAAEKRRAIREGRKTTSEVKKSRNADQNNHSTPGGFSNHNSAGASQPNSAVRGPTRGSGTSGGRSNPRKRGAERQHPKQQRSRTNQRDRP
jgi:hypothetical protein